MHLARFPRVFLAHLPTPLERLDRLTAELGGPEIWIKRDDMTGLAYGGNKARKLEYLVGDARAKNATVLVTQGAAQSNHARQTAAAAVLAGMQSVLVLDTRKGSAMTGNLLLDHALGASVRLVERAEERGPSAQRACEELREAGIDRQLVELTGEAGQIVRRERTHAVQVPGLQRLDQMDGQGDAGEHQHIVEVPRHPPRGRRPADLGHLNRAADPTAVDQLVDILGHVVDVAAPADIGGAGSAVEGPVGQVDPV